MKKKHYRLLWPFFFATCWLSATSYAQQSHSKRLPCQQYEINEKALAEVLQFEQSNKAKAVGQHYLIRVFFHVFESDDGTNAAATPEEVDTEFANLQADFAPGNICFLKVGLNYIRNSLLDTAIDGGSLYNKLPPYNAPDCINIYYDLSIKGNNPACDSCGIGGDAFAIPNTFCIVARSNLGASHATSHETGHCLGLLHTFEPSHRYEDINGDNARKAGDGIFDTRADPYVYVLQPCFAVNDNIYTGNCTDPNGNRNFSPPYTNVMAYWWSVGSGYTNLFFTTGQFKRMYAYLSLINELKDCESPEYVDLFGDYSSGYLIKSAITSLTNTSTLNLRGHVYAFLGGGMVSLRPGFHASPSNNGYIDIEASVCNYTNKNLTASDAVMEKVDLEKEEDFKIFPNPASSTIHLDFTTDKDEHTAVVQVFSMTMQKVQEIRLDNLLTGKQNVTVSLSQLASGLYYVVVQLQDKRLSAKVSLIK